MEDRMCVSRVAMRSGRYGETNINPSVLRQRLWVRSVPSSNSLPRPVSEVRFALLRRADLSHAVGHAALYYLKFWRPQLFRVLWTSRKADECLAWVQGWLVAQFWTKFYRARGRRIRATGSYPRVRGI